MANSSLKNKSNKKEVIFGYLYFKEPLVTLPKSLRSFIALVSFSIWLFISFLTFVLIVFGLFHAIKYGFGNHDVFLSFFWLGIFLLFYVLHHFIKIKRPWKRIPSLRKRRDIKDLDINIAEYFEPKSKKMLASALSQTNSAGGSFELNLFSVLLETPEAKDFLHHLELDPAEIKKEFKNKIISFQKDYELSQEPTSQTFERLVEQSFLEAFYINSESVKLYHFLMALFRDPHPVLSDLFLKHNIELEDARRVAVWLRIKNNLVFISKRPRKIKHKTMNRSWTAKPTYFLDSFSDDLTDLARHGIISSLVGHEKEYRAMINILNQDARNNTLLIGGTGSGRQAIINELARKITHDDVPKNLFDRRLVSINVGDMLAGLKTPGALQERLQKTMDEITASKNIILAIPQMHDLIGAIENQSLSFMSFFGPVFESVDFPLIASTDEKNYHQFIEKRSDLAGSFNVVKVNELSKEEAFQFLMREALILEKKENIAIGHFAVKEAIDLSDRYLKNRLLPGKAYDLLTQAVEEAKIQKKGFVSREDVRASLSKATGIPIQRATKKEGKELLNLEKKLHERLIDQAPAVKAVSEALRQARAGLERRGGPIGTFLFVGPTGVGKTELAKSLASIYFGDEDRMLRFDMSEYQSAESIYRLIGAEKRGGFLTEKIKNQPFSLLLLDEFEKAHSDVLNLFLQIFDDGRVTDEIGNVVDFTNTIIIATSNAHAILIQEKIKEGASIEKIRKLLKEKLTDIYRPELLNRFDDVIVFKTLLPEEIEQIAVLKLKVLFERIEEEQSIKFSITKEALRKLAKLGYEPKNGARPIRRAISKYIKNLIANAVLGEKLKKGNKYIVDLKEDKFVIVERKT
jgi:ATP-dependent Clp protease ATP-binding subunit ClpC